MSASKSGNPNLLEWIWLKYPILIAISIVSWAAYFFYVMFTTNTFPIHLFIIIVMIAISYSLLTSVLIVLGSSLVIRRMVEGQVGISFLTRWVQSQHKYDSEQLVQAFLADWKLKIGLVIELLLFVIIFVFIMTKVLSS